MLRLAASHALCVDEEEPRDGHGWIGVAFQLLVWWGVAGCVLLVVYEPVGLVMSGVFAVAALMVGIAAIAEGAVGAHRERRQRTPVEKPRRDKRPRHP